VGIIGRPNVGKSTLLNAFLGEKLSIATPKAQTTRHRILGMLNTDDYQIVFSDTPGVIKPAYALQESMMEFVRSSFEDADIVIYMTEPGEKALKDEQMTERIRKLDIPVLVLLNKIDLSNQEQVTEIYEYWKQQFPKAEVFPISALNKFNTDVVLNRIVELLPLSPPYYDKESLSDRSERFFVSEMIREQILINYKKEIPYSVEVDVEEFKEDKDIIRIRAVIYAERDTQKGIIIGHQGKMIKRTGTDARKRLEAFFQKKVFLDLHIKVRKNWRQNEEQLKRFGYKR